MGTLRRVRPVDIDTGEIVEEMPIVVTRKYRNAFVGGWITVSQDVLLLLANRERFDLTEYDLRVLLALMGKLDLENYVQINQSRLAKEIGILQPNISRSIKRLLEIEVIKRGPKVGNTWSYRLNPEFAYKGKVREHRKVIKEWQKMPQAAQTEVDNGSTPDHE